jgi:hypothetical protein
MGNRRKERSLRPVISGVLFIANTPTVDARRRVSRRSGSALMLIVTIVHQVVASDARLSAGPEADRA